MIARKRWGKSWRLTGRPGEAPFIIVDKTKNAMRIVAMEADDRLAGLSLDQSLGDARTIVPNLDCIQHNAYAVHELLVNLARWCERYTPLVAVSGEDGLFLDITGCTHLFGGETQLLTDLETRLSAQGFSVRSAIADTAGAAWAIARYDKTRIAKPGHHREHLSKMPISALRVSQETSRELSRVGFKTIGCLADLPRAPIASRFGRAVLQKLDQALGDEDEVLSPFQPVPEFISEKRFPEPIVYEDDIKRTLALLARNLVPGLARGGLGMRRCALVLFRVDGEIVSLTVEASTPLRDPQRIARLFEERLAGLHDDLDAGFGFDVVRLCVLHTDPLNAVQQDIITKDRNSEDTTHLVDRLSARLGTNRVQVFQLSDTHIPERRFGFMPANRSTNSAVQAIQQEEKPVTRPLILFNRPELADVIAEVPEGPPVRFRWRKAQYEVVRSEGPERIACEWWRDGRAAQTRDYFCVEDKAGYRFWLFRHGLYERETDTPKWYLHGLFG